MSSLNPPIANAIPTIFGWAHPKTGELLVSIKGLPNPVEGYHRNTPWVAPVVNIPEVAPVVKTPKPKKTDTASAQV